MYIQRPVITFNIAQNNKAKNMHITENNKAKNMHVYNVL